MNVFKMIKNPFMRDKGNENELDKHIRRGGKIGGMNSMALYLHFTSHSSWTDATPCTASF